MTQRAHRKGFATKDTKEKALSKMNDAMTSAKIICVTPNVALDRTLVVPDFALGHISRIRRGIAVPGGKGLNVVRAMRILGGAPLAMGLLGGHTGRMVAALAADEGYPAEWTWHEGETRTCTIIAPPDGNSTVINESGQIEESDWMQLADDICRVAEVEGVKRVCFCGSLPLGAPENAPQDAIRRLKAMGRQVWVDSSGAALKNAIAAKPYAIKVNQDELAAAMGGGEDALAMGRRLVGAGVDLAVISLGAAGALLVGSDVAVRARPPSIQAVDPIASGDSLHAGLLTALAGGADLVEALRAGVAAGTVNALYAGGAQFSYTHYLEILRDTRVTILPPSSPKSGKDFLTH